MRKYWFGLILLVLIPFIVGCNDNKIIPKSEYKVGEEAMIDDIYLTLTSATYNDDILELVFKIRNDTGKTMTINPESNFKLYDINRVLVTNSFTNNSNVIKKGQTVSYTLNYNVSKKEIYEIYFYSGIVENNVKFAVLSADLK